MTTKEIKADAPTPVEVVSQAAPQTAQPTEEQQRVIDSNNLTIRAVITILERNLGAAFESAKALGVIPPFYAQILFDTVSEHMINLSGFRVSSEDPNQLVRYRAEGVNATILRYESYAELCKKNIAVMTSGQRIHLLPTSVYTHLANQTDQSIAQETGAAPASQAA
jgi:hypothetical protein